jgi:basic amino acid/polyamine antiporter, APA family
MNPSARHQLSLWDSVSILVGIVIGVGIHETAPTVFASAGSAWMAMACWVLGGLLSLLGAFCYAELASAYPRSGGEYCYLSQAYGRFSGFLFGWTQLTVVRTGNVGMMAFIFAEYAAKLWNLGPTATIGLAIAAPLTFSILNILGVVVGTRAQNALTVLKMVGFSLIIVAGLVFGGGGAPPAPAETAAPTMSFGFAMLFVLFTYGGWNDAVLVTAEIRDSRKNIVRSLIIGVAIVTGFYLLVNAAYLNALGYRAASQSTGIAAEALRLAFGPSGTKIMSLIVMVSALGAVNGIIFTGARIYATMGEDHRFFAWLSRWHPRLGTPIWSLLAESAITVALILLLGTGLGRGMIDGILNSLGWASIEWHGRPFNNLFQWCAPFFWLFFLAAGLSLFVLRYRDPDIERPFRVPFYPFTPIAFCIASSWCLYSSVTYAGKLLFIGAAPVLAGCLVYALCGPITGRQTDSRQ